MSRPTGADVGLQDLLLADLDVETFLQRAVDLGAAVLPGASCGLTLRGDRGVATVAGSDDLASWLDEAQYVAGRGPCLEALRSGTPVVVDDLEQDFRWPQYRERALAHGVRSSLGIPFSVPERLHGALNFYLPHPHGFDTPATEATDAFARQLTGALTLVVRAADRADVERQLRAALDSRAVIDQAVGVVMARRGVDADTAFATLRQASQDRNRKLRDIAADVVRSVTGAPPRASRPFTDPR